jgi:hypothetical protein
MRAPVPIESIGRYSPNYGGDMSTTTKLDYKRELHEAGAEPKLVNRSRTSEAPQ